MKKQIVRKLSRREVTDVYVCEYDTPLFQAFLAYAEAFILYIIAMILGSGASSSDANNHYCVRINGIMYPLAARNVSIAVGCYVIQVRIMAPIAITNSAVLYALALYNLANSPDLLQLPRWMVRKIRRKARRVHFISSTFSCADLASMPINEIAFLKKTSYQKLFMNFKVEIVSVKRTLLHGCVGVERYASYLTASDIPNLSAMLSPYIPLLNNLPERRLYFISHFQQIGCNRTAMFLTIGYICLEKKNPGFLNSSAADVLCAVFYLLRMLPHVVWNALVQVFYVLKDTWQIANYIEAEASPSTKSLPEPKAEASSSVDSTESVQPHHDIKAPKTCTCAACKRIMPVTVKPALKQTLTASAIDSAVNIEAKEVAATVSSEKKSQDPGKVSKEGSSYEHTAESGENGSGINGVKDTEPMRNTEAADSILRAACAAVYNGYVPHFVINAAETMKSSKKTSGDRRQINSHKSNDPSLSVQSMVEFLNAMFPGCYMTDFIKAQHKGESDLVYLHTWKTEYPCPCCGEMNPRVRDGNTINVFDMPIRNGIGLKLKVTPGRAECHNEQCSNYKQSYTEKCDFVESRKYTKRVHYQMLVAGASSNFTDTSRQMKLMGVPCCEHVIGQLIKSLQFKDEVDVQVIGIDDVSYLKGRKYMTAIYSLDTGHLLKLLPGRNGEGLDEFLDAHPNVKVICRDRSSAYGRLIQKYIDKHPERKDIMQVPDRFHLMQNCSENLRKAYYKSIPYILALDLRGKTPVIMEHIPEKKAVPVLEKPENLSEWFYDNTPDTDNNGKPIEFSVVLDQRSPSEIASRKEEAEAEYKLICKVRKDYADMGFRFKNGQKNEYLIKVGIPYCRFQKYVHMTDEEVEAVRDSWKRSAWKEKSFDHFKHIAYKMLKDKHSINDVYWYIKEGKNGKWEKSDATLINYIIEVYKMVYPQKTVPDQKQFITLKYEDGILVVGRQRLFYALMTLDDKKEDSELAPYLDMICNAYPVCKTVKETFKEFHDCIIAASKIEDRTEEKRQKCIENLDAFIEKHQDDVLCGFVSHLKSDLACIRNAIMTDYHSGGVEGRNLRIKAYERLSFGKGKLSTLECRLKLGFQYMDDSFSIADVAPWLVEELADNVENLAQNGDGSNTSDIAA